MDYELGFMMNIVQALQILKIFTSETNKKLQDFESWRLKV